jgi:hypothetical protein
VTRPVELRGALVTIVPLGPEHAAGLLAAADSDEVFAWLPYLRPVDLAAAGDWIADALADRAAGIRLPFETLGVGAIEEGVVSHERRRRDGSWRDSVWFSVLSAEWPAAKARLEARLGR